MHADDQDAIRICNLVENDDEITYHSASSSTRGVGRGAIIEGEYSIYCPLASDDKDSFPALTAAHFSTTSCNINIKINDDIFMFLNNIFISY